MKKAICLVLCTMMAAAVCAQAQQRGRLQRPLSLGLDLGPVVHVGENAFSYVRNGRTADLITFHKGLQVGYDFSAPFGLRASLSWDNNAGACNVQETGSGTGFYPYRFNSLNGFVDAILGYRRSEYSIFCPKFYIGVGGAYTFGFSDSGHPWQKVEDPAGAFGFRLGIILQWRITPVIGIHMDFCAEGYTDNYNGLQPSKEDQARFEGYAGFPLDLRGLASVGVLFYL